MSKVEISSEEGEEKQPLDLVNLSTTFDSKQLIGTMIVFWGTIFLIIGGAIYCWYRYFRNNDHLGGPASSFEDPENQTSEARQDKGCARRDTLILNLRRQSRMGSLLPAPFALH